MQSDKQPLKQKPEMYHEELPAWAIQLSQKQQRPEILSISNLYEIYQISFYLILVKPAKLQRIISLYFCTSLADSLGETETYISSSG